LHRAYNARVIALRDISFAFAKRGAVNLFFRYRAVNDFICCYRVGL
jgi:hypothetical protein